MKFNFFLTLLVLGIFFWGCKKDTLISEADAPVKHQPTIQSRLSSSAREAAINSVVNENGRLKFKDQQHMLDVAEAIEDGNRAHNESFFAPLSNLTPEAVTDSMYAQKFDPQGFCLIFETKFNFKSLRQKISAEEKEWLKNEELDDESNPNNHPIRELGLRTVFNENLEVIIDGKVENFQYIVDEYEKQTTAGRGGGQNTTNASDCKVNVSKNANREFYHNGTRYKLFMHNSCVFWPWGTAIRTSQNLVRWYSRRVWFVTVTGWENAAANMRVEMAGKVYKIENCEDTSNASAYSLPTYASAVDAASVPAGTWAAVKKYSMSSLHHVNIMPSPSLVSLTW
jgi:hypothetical protein